MKRPQERWKCNRCTTEGWWTPSNNLGLPPPWTEGQHDRPDGRRCRIPAARPIGCAELCDAPECRRDGACQG